MEYRFCSALPKNLACLERSGKKQTASVLSQLFEIDHQGFVRFSDGLPSVKAEAKLTDQVLRSGVFRYGDGVECIHIQFLFGILNGAGSCLIAIAQGAMLRKKGKADIGMIEVVANDETTHAQ